MIRCKSCTSMKPCALECSPKPCTSLPSRALRSQAVHFTACELWCWGRLLSLIIHRIVIHKFLSRLRLVIGDIVDPAQTAFIKDRSIVDNIHLAQELFRKYNRKGLQLAAYSRLIYKKPMTPSTGNSYRRQCSNWNSHLDS